MSWKAIATSIQEILNRKQISPARLWVARWSVSGRAAM